MRKLLLLSALSLAVVAPAFAADAPATAPAVPAAAASTGTPHFAPAVIAVVDMQKIMSESAAAKSVRDQLGARREVYQKQVTADEQKLHEAEQALRKQQATLSAEEFAKKRTAFEAQVRAVQQSVQERAKTLDTAFNEALATIKKSLGQIVAQAASDRGATLVLDKGQVIVVESSYDITAPVLDKLNKDLPRVAVNLPADKKR